MVLKQIAVLVLAVVILLSNVLEAQAQVIGDPPDAAHPIEFTGAEVTSPWGLGRLSSFRILGKNLTDSRRTGSLDVFIYGPHQSDVYARVIELGPMEQGSTSEVLFYPQSFGRYVVVVRSGGRLYYNGNFDIPFNGLLLPLVGN
jgi:hypothetical protein